MSSNSSFSQLLESKISHSGGPLCIGVDPHFHGLPEFMSKMIEENGAPYFLEWFGESLIEVAKSENIAALKFQAAFFEAHGIKGHIALENLLDKCASNSIISILDAKRGDISSTMEAYGKAAFDEMKADVLTVTPYMGFDVISPLESWLKNGKGIYVVWMSSNPSGKDIQELETSNGQIVSEVLFDEIERKSSEYGFSEAVGYVLGATKLNTLSDPLYKKVRSKPLLMPGVGAQGASMTDERIKDLLEQNIHLIPVSRGVSGYGKGYLDEDLKGLGKADYLGFLKEKVRSFKK